MEETAALGHVPSKQSTYVIASACVLHNLVLILEGITEEIPVEAPIDPFPDHALDPQWQLFDSQQR